MAGICDSRAAAAAAANGSDEQPKRRPSVGVGHFINSTFNINRGRHGSSLRESPADAGNGPRKTRAASTERIDSKHSPVAFNPLAQKHAA